MGISFLVWNIEKASNDRLLRIINAIRSWVVSEDIHIVALLECSLANAKIINDQLGTDWQLISTDDGGMIRVFSRLNAEEEGITIEEANEIFWSTTGEYISIVTNTISYEKPELSEVEREDFYTEINKKMRWFYIKVGNSIKIICAFCHLYSKIAQDTNWKSSILISCINNLISKQFRNNETKVLLAGDLNNNPFEPEIYRNGDSSSKIFRSVPNRKVFDSPNETIRYHFKDYFYNPTWALLSDVHSEGDYRTHYTYFHPKGREDFKVNKDAYYFNCYDGVLIKKDLIPYFNHRRFKILDHYQQDCVIHSLLAEDGIKLNNDLYSDHLPIIFELNFTP